jgi:carbamoyltransferase
MKGALLGCKFSQNEIQELKNIHSCFFDCSDEEELCDKIAEYIDAGKIIGWFQGRMEFGPRALGNRSILADARNPEMQKHLNLKIKNRESFRPFAAAILEEDVHEYFRIKRVSQYMLEVHPIEGEYLKLIPDNYTSLPLKEKLYTIKSEIPAVTHVDMTARIQTVNKEQNTLFWKLLNKFKLKTGCPLMINTSFNTKDEPIVCSVTDAYNCFVSTPIDILVVEKTIFYK